MARLASVSPSARGDAHNMLHGGPGVSPARTPCLTALPALPHPKHAALGGRRAPGFTAVLATSFGHTHSEMGRQAVPSLLRASSGEGRAAQDRCLVLFSNFLCFNVPGTAH